MVQMREKVKSFKALGLQGWGKKSGVCIVTRCLTHDSLEIILDHFIANGQEGETFRSYVMRQRIETFREMTNDLAKPAEEFPELYQDWGDETAYSLKLGRGECAA